MSFKYETRTTPFIYNWQSQFKCGVLCCDCCASRGCPVGLTAGATIPAQPLPWGPSYHKITIILHGRYAVQVTIRSSGQECPLNISSKTWTMRLIKPTPGTYSRGSWDGIWLVYHTGLHSGKTAGATSPGQHLSLWSVPPPLLCLLCAFPRKDSWMFKKNLFAGLRNLSLCLMVVLSH